jgi:hypothetical protein
VTQSFQQLLVDRALHQIRKQYLFGEDMSVRLLTSSGVRAGVPFRSHLLGRHRVYH